MNYNGRVQIKEGKFRLDSLLSTVEMIRPGYVVTELNIGVQFRFVLCHVNIGNKSVVVSVCVCRNQGNPKVEISSFWCVCHICVTPSRLTTDCVW